MNNEAGPATKPRRSARATRQTHKTDAAQPEDADADAQVADPPKKRRRVAKRDAISTGEAQAVAPKPRRKAGRLSNLLDMPIDILYEVFGQLDPFDILKLTRTSKDLRNLLLNKGAVSIWRETLQNVPGLPETPPDMSIPAYVNLLFSAHCHICSAVARTVEWRYRMRICKKCAKDEIDFLDYMWGDKKQALAVLNFSQLCAIIPHRSDKRGMCLYSKSQFQRVSDEYSLLDGEDVKKQFLASRAALVPVINKHAAACEVWERNRTDSRHQDLSALKEERLAAIVGRLESLGWGDEVKGIRRPDSLADHKLVNRPQRLTDKIWSNIKEPILQFMEEMRVKRLEREFKTLIKRRKGPAMEAIREYKKSKLINGEVLPGPPDYCAFGPIQEILKKPVDIEVTPSSFDPVIPLLPGLISQWQEKLDLEMAKETGVKFWNSASAPPRRRLFDPFFDYDSDEEIDFLFARRNLSATREPQLSDAEATEKLKLASAVFICSNCSSDRDEYPGIIVGPSSHASKIMFYPQVLAHACNCTNAGIWSLFNFDLDMFMGHRVDNEPDPSTLLGNPGSALRKQWDCKTIRFNHKGKKAAEAVIKTAGLDPGKAKSQEMDDLNLRFICTTCYDPEKNSLADPLAVEDPEPEDFEDMHVNIGLFDWRGAVRHRLDRHSANEAKFLTVKPDDITDEIKIAEEQLRERTTEEWQCVHCMDSRNERRPYNLKAIKEHLLAEHEIDSPTLDEDYYRHLRAPDLHLFQRPLWVSYKVHEPASGELRLIPRYTQLIKGDDGALAKNEDGTFKEEVVDHDKYDYLRPHISDVDQYNTSHSTSTPIYDSDGDDMDNLW